MNKPIPPLTLYISVMSNSIVSWWYLWISAIALSFWLFRRYINSETGRPKWDAFTLRLPIAGPLVRMVAVTRFSSVMATLLDSGVPILTSMNIAKNLVGNVLIAEAVATAKENITEGQSIADPLRKSGQFPPMMTHMIAIGEKTGELPEMLKSIAETYEEQVNTKIDAMTSLLEPLMIVGMGISVGAVVLSVFMPLVEMMNINQR
jgi:general secretion pathway protein F